jgi:hypothetical protein
LVNQNICYIIIIPGFGVVSQVVSIFSGKPIFGYKNSPWYNYLLYNYIIAVHYMQKRWANLNSTQVIIWSFLDLYLVIICLVLYNPQVTNVQWLYDLNFINPSMLVGTSETVCALSICFGSGIIDTELKIRQWIAGIADGDGCFHISKLGYVEFTVVMEPRDIACLYKIKQRYGGTIKSMARTNAFRYRLHHKEGILKIINDLNGLIQNPVRQAQFTKVCALYSVPVIQTVVLDYLSGYLSGLFDTNGSVYYSAVSQQVFITITQKSRFILDLIASVYGGKVYPANAKATAFKWTVSRKADVLNLIDNYFHWNNCVSAKNKKFGLVKEFYRLSSLGGCKAQPESLIGKAFAAFELQWNKTNHPDGSE